MKTNKHDGVIRDSNGNRLLVKLWIDQALSGNITRVPSGRLFYQFCRIDGAEVKFLLLIPQTRYFGSRQMFVAV